MDLYQKEGGGGRWTLVRVDPPPTHHHHHHPKTPTTQQVGEKSVSHTKGEKLQPFTGIDISLATSLEIQRWR